MTPLVASEERFSREAAETLPMVPRSAPDLMTVTWDHLESDLPQPLQTKTTPPPALHEHLARPCLRTQQGHPPTCALLFGLRGGRTAPLSSVPLWCLHSSVFTDLLSLSSCCLTPVPALPAPPTAWAHTYARVWCTQHPRAVGAAPSPPAPLSASFPSFSFRDTRRKL